MPKEHANCNLIRVIIELVLAARACGTMGCTDQRNDRPEFIQKMRPFISNNSTIVEQYWVAVIALAIEFVYANRLVLE